MAGITVIDECVCAFFERKRVFFAATFKCAEVFDKRSRDKEILATLAKLYRDTEQEYSAISVYNILATVVDNNDEIAKVQKTLAELNEEIHDYPAAFEAYKACLEIYPTDVAINQNLISLYMKVGNNPKAIESLLYLATSVNDSKDILWVYENLVDLYVEISEYEKAIEYSEKLLEIQENEALTLKLARLTRELGK